MSSVSRMQFLNNLWVRRVVCISLVTRPDWFLLTRGQLGSAAAQKGRFFSVIGCVSVTHFSLFNPIEMFVLLLFRRLPASHLASACAANQTLWARLRLVHPSSPTGSTTTMGITTGTATQAWRGWTEGRESTNAPGKNSSCGERLSKLWRWEV